MYEKTLKESWLESDIKPPSKCRTEKCFLNATWIQSFANNGQVLYGNFYCHRCAAKLRETK